MQSRKVENAKAILEIRKMFATDANKEIHQHINDHKSNGLGKDMQFSKEFTEFWDKNKLNIYDYLGTLELLNIYVQAGIIDMDDFAHQYGYRLRNIIRYEELLKKIEYQNQVDPGWTDLIELMELADKSKTNYKYPKYKL